MRCRPRDRSFKQKKQPGSSICGAPLTRCTACGRRGRAICTYRAAFPGRPRRQSASSGGAAGCPCPARRDQSRRVDANRRRGNHEAGRPSGGDRAEIDHRWRVPPRLVADGFPSGTRRHRDVARRPETRATGRCPKPRQDEPANGYSSLWGAVASSGFRSGSGNWLGAGIGLSSSSESAFDSGRAGVGITGKGCGIVPSGSGVGLGSGESKGPGARERASDGGDASICTGSSAWTIAEPNVSVQKAVKRSRSWKSGRLTEARYASHLRAQEFSSRRFGKWTLKMAVGFEDRAIRRMFFETFRTKAPCTRFK